jgi:hypothetical protein
LDDFVSKCPQLVKNILAPLTTMELRMFTHASKPYFDSFSPRDCRIVGFSRLKL